MTRRWMGAVTPAEAGVHVLHTQPQDFDGTLMGQEFYLDVPNVLSYTGL